MKPARILGLSVTLLVLFGVSGTSAQELTPQEELGRLIYFDSNLSTPRGQSCASCHDPDAGFADPDQHLPVSQGVLPRRFGNRNSPTAAYAAFSPDFHYDEVEELFVGGQFWDGRAVDLVEQAKGPFLNPLEMNNPSKRNVILQIRLSDYAALFEEVYGPGALDDIDVAYDLMAEAIAAFEATEVLNRFSSKFDCYLAGLTDLTDQELLGFQLFVDPEAGNCAACHPSEPGPYSEHPLFTDYTYDNLGVPRNPENPFYGLPRPLNPDGADFVDYGLGAVVGLPEQLGKMKVPTLRNIEITAPYMHNGVFQTLTEVVDFYNTRDVVGAGWPPPEVPQNVNHEELGDLGLTDEEVEAVVAFMLTLTDGYVLETQPLGAMPPALHAWSDRRRLSLQGHLISLSLTEPAAVDLRICDISGRVVRHLLQNAYHSPGVIKLSWDGRDDRGQPVTSGVYFSHLRAGAQNRTGRMLVLR